MKKSFHRELGELAIAVTVLGALFGGVEYSLSHNSEDIIDSFLFFIGVGIVTAGLRLIWIVSRGNSKS